MSTKYTGGFITKSPVAPTTSAASGIWTLDQQQQAQKAGTWPSPPLFIEDLFSTYLYTGTGATQTISNGIDLSTKGGLVWLKGRSAAQDNNLCDTVRGDTKYLISNSTAAQNTWGSTEKLTFLTNGFTIGADQVLNTSPDTYVSWTFREQPKFFDIVTYTGNGSGAGQVINHNLGSTPGFIICKCTSTTQDWAVCARTGGAASPESAITYATGLSLNTNAAASYIGALGNFPTSTTFDTAGLFTSPGAYPNLNGQTYVAYLFAHNAGGFPASGGGSTNAISCGSYAGNGSATGPIIDLSYEPQWLLIKKISGGTISDGSSSWMIFDIMRGFTDSDRNDPYLNPNLSGAESDLGSGNFGRPLATGFQLTASLNLTNQSGSTYVYIAIRRGPMKTPTVGTSVYNAIARTGTGATANVTGVGFPVDLNWSHIRDQAYPNVMVDRLRGSFITIIPSNTDGEQVNLSVTSFASMDGVQYGTSDRVNVSPNTYINWYFRRAPGFFDEVCYTGTGTPTNFTHNLSVVPELMIVRRRDATSIWAVYVAALATAATSYLELSEDTAVVTGNSILWNSTAPTSTVFTIGSSSNLNTLNSTNVAYLFATLAGISKVGSYTGTGALLTVACGFTSGARFVLIKRTDSTGNWYMYDSVRGITSGNDPYLFADLDAVEVTGTNYVDTDTTGFKVTAAAPAGLNASGGTYIFLAIA